MNVADGNKTDQSAFPEVIKAFQSEWEGEQPDLYVMDAAFYSEANLKEFGNSIHWISRVPATIKAAQELTQTLLPEQFSEQDDRKGYRFCVVCSRSVGKQKQSTAFILLFLSIFKQYLNRSSINQPQST